MNRWLAELVRQGRLLRRLVRLGLRPESKREALERLFRVVNAVLRESKADYWLTYGTLLGYHREGRILAHDVDVDFGVLGLEFERVRAAFARLPPAFTLHDTTYKHRGPKLYVEHEGWEADIYFYEEVGDQLRSFEISQFPSDMAPFPRSHVFPTVDGFFLGEPTRAPREVEAYLKSMYGYIGPDARRDPATGYFHRR